MNGEPWVGLGLRRCQGREPLLYGQCREQLGEWNGPHGVLLVVPLLHPLVPLWQQQLLGHLHPLLVPLYTTQLMETLLGQLPLPLQKLSLAPLQQLLMLQLLLLPAPEARPVLLQLLLLPVASRLLKAPLRLLLPPLLAQVLVLVGARHQPRAVPVPQWHRGQLVAPQQLALLQLALWMALAERLPVTPIPALQRRYHEQALPPLLLVMALLGPLPLLLLLRLGLQLLPLLKQLRLATQAAPLLGTLR